MSTLNSAHVMEYDQPYHYMLKDPWLLNNSWHGSAVSMGQGSSSSVLAARMHRLRVEPTECHCVNGDHSMPDGIRTWKHSKDTELININTHMNTLSSKLGSQYPPPIKFISEDLN